MPINLRADQETQDAGKRISEAVALHLLAAKDFMSGAVGKWAAFALADGRTNNVLYDTKDEAVRDMRGRSKDHCYMKLTPDGISPYDAARYLMINRHPMIDTTAPEEVINPQIFPRFSNLTAGQRAELRTRAEREWRERHKR